METPLPFTWPYAFVFWGVYIWVFTPEFRIVKKATLGGPVPAEDGGSLRVVLVGVSISIAAAFALPFAVPQAALPGSRVLWLFLGLLVLVSGSLLRRHCFRVLGAFFTGAVTIQAGHRVVDTGAYRWVRHPSYTAGILIVLGIALALANGLGVLVSFVVAFFSYAYRAKIEEQALLASLGAPYAQFMATRKRFIPLVY